MYKYRVEISNRFGNHRLDKVCEDIKQMSQSGNLAAKQINYYLIESESVIEAETLQEVFCDEVSQSMAITEYQEEFDYFAVVDISFRAGVTDNSAHSASDALKLLGIQAEVASGKLILFKGDLNLDLLKEASHLYLANNLIEQIQVHHKEEFLKLNRFKKVKLPKVVLHEQTGVQTYNLNLSDEQLEKLSTEKCLALTVEELKFVNSYYAREDVISFRKEQGLPEEGPTDVELEVIAQSWSEHCKHKIFSAKINYTEKSLPENIPSFKSREVNGLYKTTIKASTKNIEKKRNLPWLVSVFEDNAGIVDFDKNLNLCIKVETHNSPSALDPYGGALTGILGVNRDILGCGLGARPIANTDVFCFAPVEFNQKKYSDYLPHNLMAPAKIFEGVHAGVEDGGNKSGIPTVNGAIYFDKDFSGKPLVFVGTVGVLPKAVMFEGAQRASEEKLPTTGDRIYMVGGAIGADGIHGATFSSLELDENSPATAVQIGDPLTQKRVGDFLMEARDLGLYSSVTDNGAGGLSSSVGEMATMTGGASIDLSLCPTKYPGLGPYELMISESQERMTVAVPEKYVTDFEQLALKRGVSATNIGEFTDSGYLKVDYQDQLVAMLNLEFLHDALPQMQLNAEFDFNHSKNDWIPLDAKKEISSVLDKRALQSYMESILSASNVASKESWVRRYDHEVQAATIVKPFVGKSGQGPSNSGVIWLYPHGGEENGAISVGMGMNPRVSQYDTYTMAQYSVDEAIRNVVATGGNVDQCCLLDNFCWPDPVESAKNPDGKHKMAQLVRACLGLQQIVEAYGTPLVSGKDSMKNDYRGKNKKGEDLIISIQPTLMVTAMAKTNASRLMTSDFKKAGDFIYSIGMESKGLYLSEFEQIYSVDSKYQYLDQVNIQKNLELYQYIHQACESNLLQSCHDISDGGLLTALLESSFGSELGQNLDFSALSADGNDVKELLAALFSEGPGRFVVSIAVENREKFERKFAQHSPILLGNVVEEASVNINWKQSETMSFDLKNLKSIWTGSLA